MLVAMLKGTRAPVREDFPAVSDAPTALVPAAGVDGNAVANLTVFASLALLNGSTSLMGDVPVGVPPIPVLALMAELNESALLVSVGPAGVTPIPVFAPPAAELNGSVPLVSVGPAGVTPIPVLAPPVAELNSSAPLVIAGPAGVTPIPVLAPPVAELKGPAPTLVAIPGLAELPKGILVPVVASLGTVVACFPELAVPVAVPDRLGFTPVATLGSAFLR